MGVRYTQANGTARGDQVSHQVIKDQVGGTMEINEPDENGDIEVTVIDNHSAAAIQLSPERAVELISVLAAYLARK
jgi:hypothetical protein